MITLVRLLRVGFGYVASMLDSIRDRSANVSFGDVGLLLLAIVPVMLGWVTGFILRLLTLFWAALVEGYYRGRGA